MKKKLLALMLSIMMVVSMLPMTAFAAGPVFTDVSADDWFADEVEYVYDNGLMTGVGNGKFNPNGKVTRAMVWTTLARMDGEDTTDSDPWWYAGQLWAMMNDISDGTMAEENITLEQLVTMLYRYTQYKEMDVSAGDDTSIFAYSDAADVSSWAISAMQWACGAEIIVGADGALNPQAEASRAQLAAILYRFAEAVEEAEESVPAAPATYTVTFMWNDGSNRTYDLTIVEDGETVVTLPKPSRSGYNFSGWYTADGTPFTATTKITSDMVVFAKWTKPVYVHTCRLISTVVTPPTCEERGYTTYKTCCDTYVGNYVDALGHEWGEWTVVDSENHSRFCGRDASHTETEAHSYVEGGDLCECGYERGSVAMIGETFYKTLAEAVDAVEDNETIIILPGTYAEVLDVRGGKTFTVKAAKANTVVLAGIDHQTNSPTPSTVTFENLTIDNSKVEAGWYTGTSPNIAPCVGLWGGNLNFKNCVFNVAGTSGRETGIMTWWVITKTTLSFDKCVFNGIDDHASARSMQIYGNVDMTVTGCEFNTKKDYTLKYVAAEDCTATLSGNKVYNSENFVELGSSTYPGSNYTLRLNNNTLGEGVSNFVVANEEGQTVYIDGVQCAWSTETLKAAINAGVTEILLTADEFDIDLYDVSDRDSLTIIGSGPDTKISFENQQVRASQFNKNLTIKNCTIKHMKTKSWGHLVFGSSDANGVYTIENCTFIGEGTQGIYINQNVPATFNIKNCTFDGNFGGEGAITIQNNDGVNITVNVEGCTFKNIPDASHEIFVLYAFDGWTLNAPGVTAYWKEG